MLDRFVAGTVSKDGDVTSGNGFSVNKTADGVYEVTFDGPSFPTAPTVTANMYSADKGTIIYGFITVYTAGPREFRIHTQSSTGGWADTAFSFIAAGSSS
ncbi:hypothetical protein [Streptomyces sp. bgisy084]|uniref:hypothetical protein n=1 Tax=Streptomyces sp. bgisy084 TaxID=3413777 RepID=UPI003D7405D6